MVDDGSEPNAQNTKRPGAVCYGDIELFLLRNPDNPERDILMAEVIFRNLKGGAEGADRQVLSPSFHGHWYGIYFLKGLRDTDREAGQLLPTLPIRITPENFEVLEQNPDTLLGS